MKGLTGRLGRLILHILIAVGIGYIVLLVAVYFLQSRMIYHPMGELEAHPGQLGLDYQHVQFPASDGVMLDAFYTPVADARGVVLFCHGNGGNISHRVETVWLLAELGFSSLVFDYRGYGRSEGKPDEEGTYRDVEGAWKYLTGEKGFGADQIIVHGRSLGGAVAAWIAAREEPAGLVLESTFTSIPEVASKMYWFLPVRWLCKYQYDTLARLEQIDCPVLILHSREDELVAFSESRKLFEAASEPKRFVEMGGGHNDGFALSGAVYTDALDSFASELAGLGR